MKNTRSIASLLPQAKQPNQQKIIDTRTKEKPPSHVRGTIARELMNNKSVSALKPLIQYISGNREPS